MIFLLVVAIGFLATIEGKVGTVCHNNTDCGSNECCYIEPEFLVVSKRNLPMVMPVQSHKSRDTGVCEGYRALHEQCGPLEKMNGHCSCGVNMSCQFVPAPTDTLVASKRKIFMPGPGAYQCEMTK